MGNKSRIEGKNWESRLVDECAFHGVLVVEMPLGCRITGFRNGRPTLAQKKTPYDFMLISKHGVVCVLDCKSFDSDRISHSQLTEHQVDKLSDIEHHKVRAGYLVHLRKINAIVFFDAIKLKRLTPGNSLLATDGEYIGTWDKMALGNLFC